MKRIALLAVLVTSPCLAERPQVPMPAKAALPAAAIDQRALDQIIAPIKSRADLGEYLQHMPPQSPLLALSENGRNEFLHSLVFTERGLASYRYIPLQQIDIADAYRILALFGVQSSLAVSSGMQAKSEEGRQVQAALNAGR